MTPEEKWLCMPKWKKALLTLFVIALPFIGSIESISF